MPLYPEDDDRDLPLEQDMGGEDDSLPEMICPHCHGQITEDTQKCPHCGDWITPVDPATRGRSRWLFVLAVLLMLYAMMRYVF